MLCLGEFGQSLVRSLAMWYFSWVLKIGFACGCGILNALWNEHYMPDGKIDD